MTATQDADNASATAHRASVDYDPGDLYADRLIQAGQVRAIAAVAKAIDRLAEAVENLQR